MTALRAAAAPLYIDTSVALGATLEQGTPEVEKRIAAAPLLVTSRLSLVESAPALHRVRIQGSVPERRLAEPGASSILCGIDASCGS